MINTTRGEMDEKLLTKRTGTIDNDNEHTTWIEYWNKNELLHRSVHVSLKQPLISKTEIGEF
jgi:hypothetical protein